MNLFKKMISRLGKIKGLDVEILDGIDIDSLSKDEVAERLKDAFERRETLRKQYEQIVADLATIQKVENLPKESIDKLESDARNYSELMIQKESYQKKLTDKEPSPIAFEKHKEDIHKVIKLMEDYEEQRSIIKNDLTHLEGEQAEINYRLNRSKKALIFIRYMLIITAFGSAICALILTTLHFVYNKDVYLAAIISLIVVAMITLWMFVFRRLLVFDIQKQSLLKKRAVELSNKIKIKYVNVEQYLDFEYKKYEVNSSEMLSLRWENYQKAIEDEENFRNISKNLSTLISDIERLLIRNNIDACDYITDNIDYFVSKKARKLLQNSVEIEKEQIKSDFEKSSREVEILSKLLESLQ